MEIVPLNTEATLLLSGAIDDWEAVRQRGIQTIVDLDGDVDPGVPEAPNEILYLYFPIRDEELPEGRRLHAVARLVAELAASGHPVLVHCLLGLNRSCLLAAVALSYLGVPGTEALDRLRALREGALFNYHFAEYVASLPALGLTAGRAGAEDQAR